MTTDANHYLSMIDPKLRPHVATCRVTFRKEEFIKADFEIIVALPNGASWVIGDLEVRADGVRNAFITRPDIRGQAHHIRSDEPEFVRMVEARLG